MLRDSIEYLKRIQVEAAEAQRDAEAELVRRKEWNREFNDRIKGNPLIGDGGVPGFDNDDPTI
jgi:hypothetical protein